MNHIADKQNQPDSLQRLAAQRQLYDRAKFWMAVLLLFPVVLALLGTLAPVIPPGSAFPAIYALLGIVFPILDFMLLTRYIDKLQEDAALVQELIDCDILELPWNDMLGDKPGSRTVERAVQEYRKGKVGDVYHPLRDWYDDPIPKYTLPLTQARLLCQKQNISADTAQRRSYAFGLSMVLFLFSVALVVIALFANVGLRQLLEGPALFAPSILLVAGKHYRDHQKAADNLDKLTERFAALSAEANVSPDASELADKARDLQTEIFHHRKNGPPVFTWFYRWFRKNQS